MDHSLHASNVFDKLAELYQSKFMDVSAYATELDIFLSLLPNSTPTVLEIACGPGNLTKYILSNANDIGILGIDLAPNMIELARQNCPTAKFEVMDCRNISTLSQSFDGIIVGFCLPYLNRKEAIKLIEDISKLLADGGILYLSAIEGKYSDSGIREASTGDEIFMHYYELSEIEEWCSLFHLRLISKRKTSVISNPHQDVDLVVIAQKQNGL